MKAWLHQPYRTLARVLTAVTVAAVGVIGLVGVAAAQAAPTLTVAAPMDGAVLAGTSFTVQFTVSGIRVVPTTVPVADAGRRPDANRPGEGHVHFMLDAQPLVVWERTDPYTFTNVPPGDHVLMVEITQNDHGPVVPPVARQIRFRTTALLGAAGAAPARPAGVPGVLLPAFIVTLVGLAWRPVSRRLAVSPIRRAP